MSELSLQDIASISGKPGLYRIVSPTRAGVIVEALDATKKRTAVSARQQVSVLGDIAIYALNEEGTVGLPQVLQSMYAEFGDDPGVGPKDSSEEHFALLKHVLPDYDAAQVRASDVKKLISWYHILVKEAPDLLKAPEEDNKKEAPKGKDTKEAQKPTEPKATKKAPTKGPSQKGAKS